MFGPSHSSGRSPRTDDGEGGFEDERKVRLGALAKPGMEFVYRYDFGDGWDHRVEVEASVEVDDRFVYPLCIGGARACPLEDCGGPYSYRELLANIQNMKAEQRDDLVRWVGGYFDPEGFDANAVNRALWALRVLRR
jgi:hypothetical protein